MGRKPASIHKVEGRKQKRRRRRCPLRFAPDEVSLLLFRFPLSLSRAHSTPSLLFPFASPTPPFPLRQNPLKAGSPLEAMKKKTEAAYTWAQDETAEIANTGYRLKTIYQQNKTIPRKYLTRKYRVSLFLISRERERQEREREGNERESLTKLVFSRRKKNVTTVLNTSLSYFDAAWARAREIRLHPDSTIAIQKEVSEAFFEFQRGDRRQTKKEKTRSRSLSSFSLSLSLFLLLPPPAFLLSESSFAAPQPVRLRHHPGRVRSCLQGQHPALRLGGPRGKAVVGPERRRGGQQIRAFSLFSVSFAVFRRLSLSLSLPLFLGQERGKGRKERGGRVLGKVVNKEVGKS